MSDNRLKAMTTGGAYLGQILAKLMAKSQPGTTPLELNQLALELIKQVGATPSFTTVSNYSWAICFNTGSGVVHGIPKAEPLIAGQLISIDIGLVYNGFHVDMSESLIVPSADPVPNEKIKNHLLEAGKQVLNSAIKVAKTGRRVGHISQAIEKGFAKHDLNVVKNLTGHAIGQTLHEDPMIPQYLSDPINRTPRLTKGMTLAIEVIYTPGSGDLLLEPDKWTLATKDDSLSGLFERTVIVTNSGGKIITPLPTINFTA